MLLSLIIYIDIICSQYKVNTILIKTKQVSQEFARQQKMEY